MNKFNGIMEVRLGLNGVQVEDEKSLIKYLIKGKENVQVYELIRNKTTRENDSVNGILEIALKFKDVLVDKNNTLLDTLFPVNAYVSATKCISCNVSCVDAITGKEVDGIIE